MPFAKMPLEAPKLEYIVYGKFSCHRPNNVTTLLWGLCVGYTNDQQINH